MGVRFLPGRRRSLFLTGSLRARCPNTPFNCVLALSLPKFIFSRRQFAVFSPVCRYRNELVRDCARANRFFVALNKVMVICSSDHLVDLLLSFLCAGSGKVYVEEACLNT